MGAEGDDHIDMEEFSDYYELSYHVRNALKSVLSGDTKDYHTLIGFMYQTCVVHDEVVMLVKALRALSGAVSCIDVVHHSSLLSSIYKMNFWNYGPDVMDALVELVVTLATSDGRYLDSCLGMLVSNFSPPCNFLDILKQPRGLAKKDQVLRRLHLALNEITDLMPLAPSRILEQIVRERVPNVYSKEAQIVVYVENMLLLESGELGKFVGNSMIFELINRLIDLDVEIGWDEILLDDPSIFAMELDDMSSPIGETKMHMDTPRKDYYYGGNVIAQKLDTLMDLTFDHLQSSFKSGRLVQVFEALLQSFYTTVLNTYKPKFTQFVMFYACSLDPEDCGTQFVSSLFERFTSTNHPQESRMSVVAYLGSYLSRAKFLSASFVTVILESLVVWCCNYCKNQTDEEVNSKDHLAFYAGCQAIMYVLCFRMRSILANPRLKTQLVNMPLEQIFKHALNPLEKCTPSIVEEFLNQAKAASLFCVSGTFVFNHLLESNISRTFGGFKRLDNFFPFDPYLLKKSDRFIRPNFIYWSMVRPTYDDDYDDDDDVSSDEDEVEEDGGWPMFGNERNQKMQMPSRIRPSTSPESL